MKQKRIWIERVLEGDVLQDMRALAGQSAQLAGPAAPDLRDLPLEEADAVVVSGRIRFDREMFERAPRLKVVARTGIGVDNVDLISATEEGVCVVNAPDGPTRSTAEHAVALIVALAKRLSQANSLVRSGRWDQRDQLFGLELQKLVLGIVGLGRVGRLVGAMCSAAFGMAVLGYDPYVSGSLTPIQPVARLEELLSHADIVSLHAPLTETTRHMICAASLTLMKPGAFLVNTARGGLSTRTLWLRHSDRVV